MNSFRHVMLFLCAFLLFSPIRGQDDEGDKKVYRIVAAEKLEAVLADMKIAFEKKAKGKEDAVHFYDFERNKFKIRLHNYQGKDLWIDAHFTDALTLADVNQWNARAKFSRAVLIKGEKPTVSLEAQLDCLGGTTDAHLKQFIQRFDGEILQFVAFIAKK